MFKPRSLFPKLAGRTRLALLAAAVLAARDRRSGVRARTRRLRRQQRDDRRHHGDCVRSRRGLRAGRRDDRERGLPRSTYTTNDSDAPAGTRSPTAASTTSGDATRALGDATGSSPMPLTSPRPTSRWTWLAAARARSPASHATTTSAVTGGHAGTPVAASVDQPDADGRAATSDDTERRSASQRDDHAPWLVRRPRSTAYDSHGDLHGSAPDDRAVQQRLRTTGTTALAGLSPYDVSQATAGASGNMTCRGSEQRARRYASQTIALKPKPTKLDVSAPTRRRRNGCLGPITIQTQNHDAARLRTSHRSPAARSPSHRRRRRPFDNAACNDALDPGRPHDRHRASTRRRPTIDSSRPRAPDGTPASPRALPDGMRRQPRRPFTSRQPVGHLRRERDLTPQASGRTTVQWEVSTNGGGVYTDVPARPRDALASPGRPSRRAATSTARSSRGTGCTGTSRRTPRPSRSPRRT